MKNRKILLLSFFLCASISKLFAQQTGMPVAADQKANTSENSQSRGNIYNTNLYTGVADINIPIFDYSLCGIPLGVSLSYNTKGIKVDQIASPVGLGWTLSAGAYIERDVRAIEDECTVPSVGPNDQVGPYANDNPRVPSKVGVWCENTFEDREQDRFTLVLPNRIVNFSVDFQATTTPIVNVWPKSEMQISVSYPGYVASGHPWVNSNGTNCTGPVPNQNEVSFIVGDEQGNRYFFEPKDYLVKQVVDYDSDFHRQNCYGCSASKLGPKSDVVYYYPITKWVMTGFVGYNGESITFHYDTSRISYLAYADDMITEQYQYQESSSDPIQGPTNTVNHSITVSNTATISYLTSIDYPNGTTVTLNNGTDRCDILNAPILNSVTINQKYDNVIQNSFTYKLNYAYFNTPYVTDDISDTSTELPYGNSSCNTLMYEHGGIFHLLDGVNIYTRLKLKGIDMIGTDNTSTEPYYTFNYNHTPLAPRLSPYQDWWGYYNETGSSMTAMPDGTWVRVPYHAMQFWDAYNNLDYAYYGVRKDPYFPAAQADVLTSIKNGLGGETDLYYKDFANFSVKDTNTITELRPPGGAPTIGLDADMLGANTPDGLVLDKVVTTDGFNHDNDVTVQYDYALGEQFYPGAYYWYPKDYLFSNLQSLVSVVWVNHPLNAEEFVNGSNHGFRSVTVTTSGVNGQISKENYIFSGLFKPATMNLNSLTSSQNLKLEGGWKWHTLPRQFIYPDFFGLPLQITSYDPSGNILSKKVNVYDIHPHDGYCASTYNQNPCFMATEYIDGTGTHGNNWTWNYYNLESDQGQGMPGTTASVLNIPVLTQTTTTTYANTQSKSKTINYAYDNGTGPFDYNYDNIKSETWIDEKGNTMEKDLWWNVLQPTTIHNLPPYIQHLGGEILTKSNQSNPIAQSHLIPKMYSFSTGENPCLRFPEFWNATVDPSFSFDTVRIFTQFDNHSNVLETRYCKSGTYSSNIWDTRIGQKVAEVQNARFSDIAYSSFEGAFSTTTAGTIDYTKGNWEFDPNQISHIYSMTGHYAYFMSPMRSNNVIRNINPLTRYKKYIVSFWTNGNVPQIYTSASYPPTMPPSLTYFTPTMQQQVGDWKFYTATIIGNGDDIYLSPPSTGADLYLDDLRLYPFDATMNTYTYEPLLGVGSHSDEHGNITYYEYDVQGSLKAIKDINGNILSLTKTIIQGTDN